MGDLDKNPAVKAMVVFRKAMRTIDAQVAPSYKNNGLTQTQFAVLDVLYAKGEMTISRLIASILATSGNMTVVIKNMERNGWIYRSPNPDDRRASVVGLTEVGKQLIQKALPDHIAMVESVFSVMTEEEQLVLIDLLKKFKSL
ncbi:MarR family winged helix-turn-helix transcriptional regulator [Streptococcus mutans]|uniref:MarR family winged helix-turn-helix transcriptional regulator n=1 Tax=Streptococcus mutans TaxID=1309 RepID=UPI0002B554F7|nr:MarR family transcriptional regulator [Streptococcus mutans]EMB53117.1 MarR family transcriptional regulator [Streptococcus mutans 1ID3]EMC02716.1 MarR family transcriptional regulator [Streptococcus mutans N34]EMC08284.1 MarR family transcriptional regulator [Streptococcus mutans NLML5]MBT3148492.1 MarR family transcriptional regulator [Streptococcus mutans]MBW3480161.1 MarR family transcriptional regulator [Streptococcus mutans]